MHVSLDKEKRNILIVSIMSTSALKATVIPVNKSVIDHSPPGCYHAKTDMREIKTNMNRVTVLVYIAV